MDSDRSAGRYIVVCHFLSGHVKTTDGLQIFLLCDDLDRSKWTDRLADTRSAYDSLKEHFLKYINNPNDLQSTIDPLAEDEEACLNPALYCMLANLQITVSLAGTTP